MNLLADWPSVFTSTVPPLEIFARGTMVYLGILVLLRVTPQRESGGVGTADLLMIVLIADAAQNAMASDYKSVTDGFVLIATLIFWNFALDWLGFHVPAVRRLLKPPPLRLVKDGKILHGHMRRALVTEPELLAELRKQGLDKVEQVKRADMEGDGQISVTPMEKPTGGKPPNKKGGQGAG